MSNVYILHYTPLEERKKFMDDQLSKQNMIATYVSEYDRENISDDDKIIFKYNNNLSLSNSSLILKHLEAYKKIVDSNQDFGLIIEDDVVLNDNFSEKYLDYYNQLPENWDILFYGDGWRNSLHVPQRVMDELGGNVFLKCNQGTGIKERNETGWPVCSGSTRCSDCYIIKNETAKKILNYVEQIKIGKQAKIERPSDLWMNQLFRNIDLKVYWGEPTISTQGTESGMFKSSHR